LVESSLFALLGELPLAGLCFWLARDARLVETDLEVICP
jgi:hypothetical protein